MSHQFSNGVSASIAATSYGAGWSASGQVPLREVEAGRLDRFGSIDPTEGGSSQRHSLYGTVKARPSATSEFTATAYLVSYRLAIFSNFTFFSRDPVNGDMIEQNDARTIAGGAATYRFQHTAGPITFDGAVGLQARSDWIENSLHYGVARERLATIVHADVRETALGVWAQEEISWTRWLRTIVGLRADGFIFDVSDRLEDVTTLDGATSGVRNAAIVSPKATVVFSPLAALDIYLNFGSGFHSNDARGVVRTVDPVTPLTRGLGYEVGARTRLFDRLDLAGAVFLLDLGSELVWVGDEGTTEARGATRRFGGELEARFKALDWLFADLDLTLSRATYTSNAGNGDAVALAPTVIVSGGVSARHPWGIYGRASVLYIASRPATEDAFITAAGFARVDASLGYKHQRFEVTVTLQNALNTAWREAQFANVSRLPNEQSSANCPASSRASVGESGAFQGCEDLHFTPGAPINVQASVSLFF